MVHKYNIEGNIDFYKELYESLDDDDTPKMDEDTNVCLITNATLEPNHIQLLCNHRFNYVPLYNDLCKQKKNGTEAYHKKNLIKCPYCRSLQEYILPLNDSVTPVYGVNTLNNIFRNEKIIKSTIYNNIPIGYIEGMCEYKVISQLDPPLYVECSAIYVKPIENKKCYCMHHKYLGLQLYWNQLKEEHIKKKEEQKKKIKEDKLVMKAQKEELKKNQLEKKKKEKEDIKKQKETEKEKEKEKKETTNFTCSQILKSGVRKGQECGCKTQNVNKLCNRHNVNTGSTL
jgi:hypothetical protein